MFMFDTLKLKIFLEMEIKDC